MKDQVSPSRLITDHYRCPENLVKLAVSKDLSNRSGYFHFGADAVCFGQCAGQPPADSASEPLHDCIGDSFFDGQSVELPFDPVQVIHNLRFERYKSAPSPDRRKEFNANGPVRKLYYLIRPLMTVGIRKHLQRHYFRNWERIQFPRWPVDFTTENVLGHVLLLVMKARNIKRVPIIWFWPDGAPSCAIMTHDVETSAGRDYCSKLMDVNDRYGIKSAFQVIPEERYEVPQTLLDEIQGRGFELNVHDLNHDGHLIRGRTEFLRRATEINRYGRKFKASGFRSAMLHRNLEWYDALEFSYDMSVPNVAHLDPQRGGCCTVFPFFNGRLLEIPVTMIQDYSLFHILGDYSIDRWKQQIELITRAHGLMNFIVHPDYILEKRERDVYESLLDHLRSLREQNQLWMASPGEVDRWWRQRSAMRLIQDQTGWRIEGEGCERARIAFAREEDGKLVFDFDDGLMPELNLEETAECAVKAESTIKVASAVL